MKAVRSQDQPGRKLAKDLRKSIEDFFHIDLRLGKISSNGLPPCTSSLPGIISEIQLQDLVARKSQMHRARPPPLGDDEATHIKMGK